MNHVRYQWTQFQMHPEKINATLHWQPNPDFRKQAILENIPFSTLGKWPDPPPCLGGVGVGVGVRTMTTTPSLPMTYPLDTI